MLVTPQLKMKPKSTMNRMEHQEMAQFIASQVLQNIGPYLATSAKVIGMLAGGAMLLLIERSVLDAIRDRDKDLAWRARVSASAKNSQMKKEENPKCT